MKRPQFVFSQGSTPTLAFYMPYEIEDSDIVYATMSQEYKTVTEYTQNGTAFSPPPTGSLTVDEDCPCRVYINMTQADTMLFESGDVELQVRTKKENGSADTTFRMIGEVVGAQKQGVI